MCSGLTERSFLLNKMENDRTEHRMSSYGAYKSKDAPTYAHMHMPPSHMHTYKIKRQWWSACSYGTSFFKHSYAICLNFIPVLSRNIFYGLILQTPWVDLSHLLLCPDSYLKHAYWSITDVHILNDKLFFIFIGSMAHHHNWDYKFMTLANFLDASDSLPAAPSHLLPTSRQLQFFSLLEVSLYF